MRLSPLDPDAPINITDLDATPETVLPDKKLKKKIRKRLRSLTELQARLYADGRYALLVVLQGRDTAGKDGTIRTVFGACNPQGCDVTSFKQPTPLEARHDFLWRVHQVVPPHGMIGIFNRSHYEDVLTARVHELVPKHIWQERYTQINAFEHMLTQNRVVVLKFFLHISCGEQRRRLLKRATKPDKNWKMHSGDLDDRASWDVYSEAYHDALRKCTTPHAPWYVVPADDKRMRDYLIAGVLVRTLQHLDLQYPPANPDVLEQAQQVLAT
jgi:PPK2 family polyphosphate:nucleotide phosphotransferase